MLGLLSSKSEVGIYDYSDKMIKLGLAIVTSLGIVMLPRMANTIIKGNLIRLRILIEMVDFVNIAISSHYVWLSRNIE